MKLDMTLPDSDRTQLPQCPVNMEGEAVKKCELFYELPRTFSLEHAFSALFSHLCGVNLMGSGRSSMARVLQWRELREEKRSALLEKG